MKRQLVTIIAIVMVLLGTPIAALAQGYSFSLDEEDIIVFLNEDGSISLDYTFVFTNDIGAHEIDFVDVGMPNDFFEISSVFADVNGMPVNVSAADYQGIGSGFAVVLGTESIEPGQTGTVRVTVGRITSVLNPDAQDANYASFKFTPTWFGSDFVHGNTDLTATFYLPPGVQAEEPRFHLPDDRWTGVKEPVIEFDENGRILYTWHDENANGYTGYTFGASFPLDYVPAYAAEPVKPTDIPFPTFTPRPTTPPKADGNGLNGWWIVGGVIVLIISAGYVMNRASSSRDDRLGYLPPQISIEGYGIKRGLTAVEAAIVLEQPLEKILTMILFGIVKKGAAKIAKRDPLRLEIATNLPNDLYGYEKGFLDAFHIENPKIREERLQWMFIDLIKAVSEKLRGFNRDETHRYYREIIQTAWKQVREANTPEVKNREFDRNFGWLMLNHSFNENVRELFEDPAMTTPQWWDAYGEGFKLPDSQLPTPRNLYKETSSREDSKVDPARAISRPHPVPAPTAKNVKPESSKLPGADYAASIVNSVQDFSSRVINNIDRFTDRVHEVTSIRPDFSLKWDKIESSSGVSDKTSDGFFSLFGGSDDDSDSRRGSSSSRRRSSGSRHSRCACACAGCACACAGSGR